MEAARHGHLDCLEYVHKQKIPLNEDICFNAAYGCHFDCLEWLLEQDCIIQETNAFLEYIEMCDDQLQRRKLLELLNI